jgi:protein-S-isoprenylcysteine O-methyltransferase Ste14
MDDTRAADVSGVGNLLARLRVPLGFALAVVVLWLARPTPGSLLAGSAVAAAGEALRFWAAGHLNKSNEVTASGPYRWMAHPLYVGSAIMGGGLAIASGRLAPAVLVGAYLAATLTAAVRREEAFLRARFGAGYDRYRREGEVDVRRRFSAARAVANHEGRAVAGLAGALLLLGLKAAALG